MRQPIITKKLNFTEREKVLHRLRSSSSPGFDYYLLIFLSCIIATYGLITDSTAVIIGAMLVAPLMTPILGLSLSSVAGEQLMYRKSLLALITGSILAILLSALVSYLAYHSPFGVLNELPKEVLVRVNPTPFDLLIALAGGAAAAYAMAQPNLSEALPGVAISTALMPPLCNIGIGIAINQIRNISGGSALLFLTNLAAISFAGIIVFTLLGFRPLQIERYWRGSKRHVIISGILMTVIAVPLIILTLRFVNDANRGSVITQAITTELTNELPDATLVELSYTKQSDTLLIDLTIRGPKQPEHHQVVNIQSGVANQLNQPVALQLMFIPLTRLDPLIPPTPTSTPTPGPSSTPTATPTSTATSTATPTSTFTPTLTATATITPTPIIGQIDTGKNGIYALTQPNGNLSHFLPEGSIVQLTSNRLQIEKTLWLEVNDLTGRTGWVMAQFVRIQP
jgi:uncharacterized hydrophobic protein (TIGR00271 family)